MFDHNLSLFSAVPMFKLVRKKFDIYAALRRRSRNGRTYFSGYMLILKIYFAMF